MIARPSQDLVPAAAVRGVYGERALPPHRVLLASDGSPRANAATKITALLAQRYGMDVDVVWVPPALPLADELLERREGLLGHVWACAQDGRGWHVDLAVGVPSTVIPAQAEANQSDLIVMGLRPHGTLDRLFRNDTTLRVIRETTVPVLAIVPSLTELPRKVIAAVDFSRASLHGVRAALHIAGEGATILLAHVQPEINSRSERDEGAAVIYSQGMLGAFARLRKELHVPEGVRVESLVLRGDPALELLSLADRSNADLIAIGMQHHAVSWRPAGGSVTMRLVRDGRISLLAIPPAHSTASVARRRS